MLIPLIVRWLVGKSSWNRRFCTTNCRGFPGRLSHHFWDHNSLVMPGHSMNTSTGSRPVIPAINGAKSPWSRCFLRTRRQIPGRKSSNGSFSWVFFFLNFWLSFWMWSNVRQSYLFRVSVLLALFIYFWLVEPPWVLGKMTQLIPCYRNHCSTQCCSTGDFHWGRCRVTKGILVLSMNDPPALHSSTFIVQA